MTDVQTAVQDVSAVAEDDDGMSADERAWWHARRELAYHALATGASYLRVAHELRISYPTLYRWRHHYFWLDRTSRETQARARAHAAAFFGLDEVAVASLRSHLEKSPAVALRYILARGLLASPSESGTGSDWWVHAARSVVPQPDPLLTAFDVEETR